MKRTSLTLSFLMGMLAWSQPVLAEIAKPHNAKEANVLDFLDTAFNKRQPEAAFAKYGAKVYRQHNPMVADGPEAAIKAFNGFLPQVPGFRYNFKRVLSSGNLVVVHSHVTTSPQDRGAAVVDIFRLDHGKIVEHWDVNQPVPEKSANDNTMF